MGFSVQLHLPKTALAYLEHSSLWVLDSPWVNQYQFMNKQQNRDVQWHMIFEMNVKWSVKSYLRKVSIFIL
jgi:hypothetical protein